MPRVIIPKKPVFRWQPTSIRRGRRIPAPRSLYASMISLPCIHTRHYSGMARFPHVGGSHAPPRKFKWQSKVDSRMAGTLETLNPVRVYGVPVICHIRNIDYDYLILIYGGIIICMEIIRCIKIGWFSNFLSSELNICRSTQNRHSLCRMPVYIELKFQNIPN
jgi:hypothetical protein